MTLDDAMSIGACEGLAEPEPNREALLVLHDELLRVRGALDFLESEIERREAQLEPAKGMGSSIRIGDFVSAPPSVISRLRWHLRNIRGER